MNNMKMLYVARIEVSKGIDVNKTSKSVMFVTISIFLNRV